MSHIIYLHHVPFACVIDWFAAMLLVQQLEAQYGVGEVALVQR